MAQAQRDKTMLVTGSTDGIGRETALELAQTGAKILLHGRSAEKCRRVLREISHQTGNDRLDFVVADFRSMRQVRAMAGRVQELTDRLDVLINNAGVQMRRREETEDGFEVTFAVNHLAPFLLTNLLLDLVKKSSPARIVNVSSMTHQSGRLDFDDLQSKSHFDGQAVYATSKLCNVLFTRELARRLGGTGVTANCLHPGVVDTKLLHVHFGGGAPVQDGAATPVYLATSPDVSNVSGAYFVRKQQVEPAAKAKNEETARRLWRVSAELVGTDT